MPRGVPKNPEKTRAKRSASMKSYYKEHPEVQEEKRARMLGDKNPAKKPEVKKKLRKPKSEEGRKNMKGHSGVYPRMEEYKAKQSIATKKKWEDPEYYAKMCKVLKKRWEDPGYRQRMVEVHTGHRESEESGKKRSETLKAQYASGRVGGMKGKHQTQEAIEKIREGNIGKVVTEGQRENYRRAARLRWKDPEYIKNVILASNLKPNKPERFLTELLQEFFPNEWKYVGDFQVWIVGKNPDFININGQKKIIEFFGSYWHKPEEEQQRTDHFARHGWKTLVIWERELDNMESVIDRVRGFKNG